MGAGRRRGNRVAPADGPAVDLELQCDELAWFVLEQRGLVRLEEERLDVVGDVLDLPADQGRAAILTPHGGAGRVTVQQLRGRGALGYRRSVGPGCAVQDLHRCAFQRRHGLPFAVRGRVLMEHALKSIHIVGSTAYYLVTDEGMRRYPLLARVGSKSVPVSPSSRSSLDDRRRP